MEENRIEERVLYKAYFVYSIAYFFVLLILIGIVGDEIRLYIGRMIMGFLLGGVLSITWPILERNFPIKKNRKLYLFIFIVFIGILVFLIGKENEDLLMLFSLLFSFFGIRAVNLFLIFRNYTKRSKENK